MPKGIGYSETSKMIFGFGKKKKKKKKKEHELDARMRKELKDAGFSDKDIEGLMKKKKKG